MELKRRGLTALFALFAAWLTLGSSFVHAQPPRRGGPPRGGPPAAAGAEDPVSSPAELQRMFDAYALLQAQEQLGISDEQYPRFVTRFKALQDVRRNGLMGRGRIIQELRGRAGGQMDEAALRERLKALQDLDARNAEEMRKAYEALDQVLDIRQQVRLRIFEEQMERRKVELLSRARRNRF
jgi:hypothetical protein